MNARAEKFLHTLIVNHLGEDVEKLTKEMGKLSVQNQKTDHKGPESKSQTKIDHKGGH